MPKIGDVVKVDKGYGDWSDNLCVVIGYGKTNPRSGMDYSDSYFWIVPLSPGVKSCNEQGSGGFFAERLKNGYLEASLIPEEIPF